MKSFKDALTKGKRAGVNELNAKRIILNKINVSFIVDFLHYVNQIFIITYKVVLLLIISVLKPKLKFCKRIFFFRYFCDLQKVEIIKKKHRGDLFTFVFRTISTRYLKTLTSQRCLSIY